jgi:V/A-type H+-transporting ATPase subunit I
MSIRPVRTRWFEMLTSRDDLAVALEALAKTERVELETHSETHARLNLNDLQKRMDEYSRLARRYHPFWPDTDRETPTTTGRPSDILDAALHHLRRWEKQAEPLVIRLETLTSEQDELEALSEMLQQTEGDTLDYALLTKVGPALTVRLFALPAKTRIEQLPASLLVKRTQTSSRDYLLAVGPPEEVDALAGDLVVLKGHSLHLPVALHGNRTAVLEQITQRLDGLAKQITRTRQQIDDLSEPWQLKQALADINRLEWLLTHVATLPVTENFAWVTGWSSDTGGQQLKTALANANVNAIIEFPSPPRETRPPTVLKNPKWAEPFELFAHMLGTPEENEADPSLLLAILAPLLFGYMFGDVGHGLVLLIAGLLFQKRWPITRILIANGVSAILFGFVFGSIFGREDLIPALWVHPIEHPLPVLLVPLVGGVVILMLGLILNAMEAWWRRELLRWAQVEAAVMVLYLSVIASFLHPQAWMISSVALVWYFAGSLLQSDKGFLSTVLTATGVLVESVFQLLVNTISFVRVGAFALAHGGLSLAFITLANTTESLIAGFVIMLVGNLVVIMLEGLVVTIQTTRLILFEFFIRFLQCTGRMFRPLEAPATITANTRREM